MIINVTKMQTVVFSFFYFFCETGDFSSSYALFKSTKNKLSNLCYILCRIQHCFCYMRFHEINVPYKPDKKMRKSVRITELEKLETLLFPYLLNWTVCKCAWITVVVMFWIYSILLSKLMFAFDIKGLFIFIHEVIFKMVFQWN